MNELSIGGAEEKSPDRAGSSRGAYRVAARVGRFFAQYFLLVIVVSLAAVLRFYDLARNSLWHDEMASWQQARLPFFEMLAATAQDNYPPLHNIILHLTIAIFGDSEQALRAPSALLGVVTIYALYRLGALLWDRTTGLTAALLLTVSGFHVWYSAEVRMYSLLALTATAFVLTSVYAAQRPKLVTLVANAAAGTALLYSHVYGSFVFAGVNLFVLIAVLARANWIAVDWKRWLITQTIPVVLFLLWVPYLLDRGQHVMSGFWIGYPTARFVLHQFSQMLGSRLALAILGAFAGLSLINIEAISAWRRRIAVREPLPAKPWHWLRTDWQTGIILAWLLAPIFAGYLISIVGQPIFLGRYLICALPAFSLLAARGLAMMIHNRLAFVASLAIVVGISLPNLQFQAFERLKSDSRHAMREFSMRYVSSDLVLTQGEAALDVAYYYRGPMPNLRSYDSIRSIDMQDENIDRFWLIIWTPHRDEVVSFVARVRPQHELTYSNSIHMLHLYLFERNPLHTEAEAGP